MDRPRSPDLAARIFGARPEHRLALLRAAWPAAVGPEIARRTEVVAFDRGALRIKVPDGRWQKNLLRMRRDILSRLRDVAGEAAPRALGFVTGEVPEVERPPARPAIPASPPTPAPASVTTAAGTIPDPEIRDRFLETAGRYLARFGGQDEGDAGSSSGGG